MKHEQVDFCHNYDIIAVLIALCTDPGERSVVNVHNTQAAMVQLEQPLAQVTARLLTELVTLLFNSVIQQFFCRGFQNIFGMFAVLVVTF